MEWAKHKKCKVKYCKDGVVGEAYETLCGSRGIKMEYCHECAELWREDFQRILAGLTRKQPELEDQYRFVEFWQKIHKRRRRR